MRDANAMVRGWLKPVLVAGVLLVGGAVAAIAAPPGDPAAAPPAAGAHALGIHGMTVFGGREALYAGHLPLFHAPHDTQMVLRFHLADPARDAALRAELAARPQLWTLEPERFDLLRLDPGHPEPLRRFTARFVQGHFERGGTERIAGQTVIVDDVLLFRRLDAAPRVGDAGVYRVIGRGSEWFAFKLIDRRPDFDQLLVLTAPRTTPPGTPTPVKMTGIGVARPPATASIDRELRRQLGPGWRVRREIYFETGDLR